MKTPIAVLLTDTHLSDSNIEINKSIYRQAIVIAKELGLSEIEHAGDIFHSRKAQTQSNLDAFDDILEMFTEEGVKLNVVVGNHDKTDYGSEVSFVKQFRYHPAVHIFSTGGCKIINGINFYYASYFSDLEYISQLKTLTLQHPFKQRNVILTHIGVSGAVMNNGTRIESQSIIPSLFKDFDLTLIGHYHDAQILADGKIRYIGASIQHNYGELTGKGATILYDDLSTEIIPLKYPQYLKYEISPKEITASDIADIKKEKSESGDNIRIVLTGTDAEVKSFNKSVLENIGISVTHKTNEISKEEIEQRVEPFSATTLLSEFEAFCEKNKLDLNAGMKYFNEGVLGINKQTLELV